MKILELTEKCMGCGACRNICPVQCITMEPNEEGFIFPRIDAQKCIQCARCENVCTALLGVTQSDEPIKACYGWNHDDNVRKMSSSGGAFSALCEITLARQGIIYGAVFDAEQMRVRHIGSDECDWHLMRKSKYVQSDIDDTYSDAKRHLDEGRQVLFSGTPCQIHGLQLFLGREYENLLSVDFICHGVPPMLLLNDHLKAMERKYRAGHVNDIDFRPKTAGWSQHSLKLVYVAGTTIETPVILDIYFQGFLSNLTLRISCYHCQYVSCHTGDITIADFWGIHTYKPAINDEKGISLLLLNTKKGQLTAQAISDRMLLLPLKSEDFAYCLKARSPIEYPIFARNEFYAYYRKNGYSKASAKFLQKGMAVHMLKQYIKMLLGKKTLMPVISRRDDQAKTTSK